jgi:hypothetical protein
MDMNLPTPPTPLMAQIEAMQDQIVQAGRRWAPADRVAFVEAATALGRVLRLLQHEQATGQHPAEPPST